MRACARATRAEVRSLIADAVRLRELRADTDVDSLARAVEVTLSGSLMTWASYQDGPLAAWMRADPEIVLRPYRVSSRRKARKTG